MAAHCPLNSHFQLAVMHLLPSRFQGFSGLCAFLASLSCISWVWQARTPGLSSRVKQPRLEHQHLGFQLYIAASSTRIYFVVWMRTMSNLSSFWHTPYCTLCVLGRFLAFAVSFFFSPLLSDVVSVMRMMCLLTWITTRLIISVTYLVIRHLDGLASPQPPCPPRFLRLCLCR
ncbi:hypothetical protein PAXRUDRAFT_520870 [Paxillus rubicundulus Ve08.2h10]|uniref:Uncharacterized protein n=1 Tax=Paxillus rubicundulus Ve08.2h10 TaxID=930991 RepID=A0A0D0DV84_9AGAM|nr:hypothetical protein PAXRUDRAFT_520870 [Paxillus rubicundulus Ve08.2h10]